jgi:hypothetical protein
VGSARPGAAQGQPAGCAGGGGCAASWWTSRPVRVGGFRLLEGGVGVFVGAAGSSGEGTGRKGSRRVPEGGYVALDVQRQLVRSWLDEEEVPV